MNPFNKLPEWTGRIEPHLVKKLYRQNADSIYDEELADTVGFALLERAYAFRQTLKAHHKNIVCCPLCEKQAYSAEPDLWKCDCGWTVSKKDYHLTYKSKQLTGESTIPMVEEYISSFTSARSYAEKMRAIDVLLHRFHWEIQNTPTRPLAVNFVNLRLRDAVKFVIELGFQENGPEAKRQFDIWLKNAVKAGYY